MAKKDKDKNPESKKSKKDPELVDFLFNNADTFKKGFTDLMAYGKNIWDVLPEIMYNIFYSIFDFMQKVVLRLRSHFALKLTEDMKHLDVDKKLWEYLMGLYAKDNLTQTIKKFKRYAKTDKEKDYFNLVGHYVKNDKKDNFLSCCITLQNHTDFVTVRNKLIGKMNKGCHIEDTESIFETETDINVDYNAPKQKKNTVDIDNDVYSKDIFTPISNKTEKKIKYKSDIDTDITSTARVVSVVKTFNKKNKTDNTLD